MGRNLARPFGSKSPLRPIVEDGPANISLSNICFSISAWIALLTYEVPNHNPPPTGLLSSRWHESLNCPICPRVSYLCGTPISAYIISLFIFLLLICLMLLVQPEEHRRVNVKLFFPSPQYYISRYHASQSIHRNGCFFYNCCYQYKGQADKSRKHGSTFHRCDDELSECRKMRKIYLSLPKAFILTTGCIELFKFKKQRILKSSFLA